MLSYVTDETKESLNPAEKRFAERVRSLREEKGWTQSDLASRMAELDLPYVTQSTVSRIEQKARPVRMIEAQAISRIFGRPVALLMSTGRYEAAIERAEEAHNDARRKYVAFRRAVVDVLEAQRSLIPRLEELQNFEDQREQLDPSVKSKYESLVLNLGNFLAYDFAKEVSEFGDEVERERMAEMSSKAGRFISILRERRLREAANGKYQEEA